MEQLETNNLSKPNRAWVWLVVTIALIVIGTTLYLVQQTASVPLATNEAVTTNTTTTAREPDSASTLESPQKIATADGKQYFYYGAPAGQNNATPKKIIISLPGHGTTAETGYGVWQPHIIGGSYALASLNWWDGGGETKANYYSPSEVQAQTKAFLTAQGYSSSDVVVLEGFSRGSANTYAVIANDKVGGGSIFDAAISASGGYQSDFPLFANQDNSSISPTLFANIPWVLVCGGLDDNPDRDGCPAMENTKTFLNAHGANVLAILEDPNAGHGAFHMSSLGFPKQALDLIAKALGI